MTSLCLAPITACDDGEKQVPDLVTVADTGSLDGLADAGDTDTARADTHVGPTDASDDAEMADLDVGDTFVAPAHVFPLSPTPYTTLQRVWGPNPMPEETATMVADGELLLTDIRFFETVGIEVTEQPGEPWTEYTDLAPSWTGPPAGATPQSLLYLYQVADSQLIDEESPIRFEGVYLAPVGSAYKPHSHVTTQVFESHIRTARRISEASGRPFDAAVVTGDLVDGGQINELEWFATIIGGGVVDPDSGRDDDPIPGAGNDFNDPFYSAGIGVPWYASIGNHEVLYSGFWEADAEIQAAAVGDTVINVVERLLGFASGPGLRNGFRDGSMRWAPVVDSGTTVPDDKRAIASLRETMQLIYEAPGEPAGHGFTSEDIDAGRGYFSVQPVPGKPIRLIVLETLSEDSPAPDGALDRAQFEWLIGELIAADNAGELVIVASHHGTDALISPSPVSSMELADALAARDNVVLHLTGHGHHADRNLLESTTGGVGHWELMAPGTVDFPMQSRIVELVYEGDGYLSVYVTNVEHNAPEGSLTHEARRYGLARKLWFSNDYVSTWQERAASRNMLLRFELPDSIATRIESETWPTRIESLETLAAFE